MSFPYFIAHRIHFAKGSDRQRVSPPAIRIAIAGIAIGLVVMILSMAIVVGFKKEIREKVIGFGGHLQIHAMDYNKTYETVPVCISDSLLYIINNVEGVTAVKPYITKPAVLKTADDFLAVVIKGMENGENCLKKGECLVDSLGERDILISEIIASKMNLSIGDKVRLYFIKADQNADQFAYGAEDASIKTRQLTVVGIYDSGLNEYDRQMVFAGLSMLQDVNGWDEDMVSGIEANIVDFSLLEDIYYDLISVLHTKQDRRGTAFHVQTIEQLNPQIFAWLDLLDTNVWVILILMSVVASFTMISGLLIIILERKNMIGILKAMGCRNRELRGIFLYVASFLIFKGLVIGDIIGLVLCLIQQRFHIISLDPTSYYLEYVPISLNVYSVLIINIGTIIISLLIMIVPSSLVARISPAKVLQS